MTALDPATMARLAAEGVSLDPPPPPVLTVVPDRPAQAVAGSSAAAAVKPNPVKELTRHFTAAYDLLHDQGRAYAVPRGLSNFTESEGATGVAIPLGAELRRKIVRISGTLPGAPLTGSQADTVMLHLEAKAHEGPATPLALRFHHDPTHRIVCIDLARPDGLVVVIDAAGWSVEAPPEGVVFRRSHASKPLPFPATEGTGRLLDLAPILALDPASEAFRALVGWVIGLPFEATVRPGVLLISPPGSGKSTRLRLAASIVEPSSPAELGSAFGRNFGDDQVRALHRAIPLWDNLSGVSGSVSDMLCTLITGTARETRRLYSDNDLNVMPIARPVGLTAVGVPAGLRPDALDRLVTAEIPPVAEHDDDAEVQARFDHAHAGLLGALCDAVSAALRFFDAVPSASSHRMASHVRILAAVDAATAAGQLYGCPPDLLGAYADLSRRVKERTAADDTFGGALLALLEVRGGVWQGKASELLAAAGMYAPLGDRHATGWPSSARRVPEVLNHLRDGLDALGITWQTGVVRGSTRYAFVLAPDRERP